MALPGNPDKLANEDPMLEKLQVSLSVTEGLGFRIRSFVGVVQDLELKVQDRAYDSGYWVNELTTIEFHAATGTSLQQSRLQPFKALNPEGLGFRV